jgi:ribosomal protein L12E/L44/L45/RPP1/RPP2
VSSERRFLRHTLSLAVHLNHSSSRFKQLLSSIGADLPPTIANLLPPPLVPVSEVLFPTAAGAAAAAAAGAAAGATEKMGDENEGNGAGGEAAGSGANVMSAEVRKKRAAFLY